MEETGVRIPTGDAILDGDLSVPPEARGLVLFAHGSGSSRFSPRNRLVAAVLERRLATLLFDLGEADLWLLARRIIQVADWAAAHPRARHLRIGYFGAATGAAAALLAAAERPELVDAVIARSGRPDLAGEALPRVYAPTLLLVGADDAPGLQLNQLALPRLAGVRELAVVPGASQRFHEPGALGLVAKLARDWLETYLGPPGGQPAATW